MKTIAVTVPFPDIPVQEIIARDEELQSTTVTSAETNYSMISTR